ncbi:hypothetical protein Tco_1518411, partial [Tanacetum coccineum]
MDNLNITMEEYIRLEEEKARRRGKVYNWEIATYGKIGYDENVHDLESVETEFPAIVFNDKLTSEATLSCEPIVSSLTTMKLTLEYRLTNLTIKITRQYAFLPSPEPIVSYFDYLDFFKDFEKEFPAIVYNDAQTSKLDLLTEPILSPQHIDEFNLKDETSMSE